MKDAWFLHRVALASLGDALRYTSISARSVFQTLRHRQRFSIRPFLGLVWRFPSRWLRIYRVRTVSKLCIRRHDNGFFANVLAVLDVVANARADCAIFVDWTLDGTERQFRYGEPGLNVWDEIFEPLSPLDKLDSFPGPAYRISQRLSPLLVSRGRNMLADSRSYFAERSRYHQVYRATFRIRNKYVEHELEEYRAMMKGKICLGVHKRVGYRHFASHQRSFQLPDNKMVIECIERTIRGWKPDERLIYLATDDLDCAELFSRHFGNRLICRSNVQRVRSSDDIEVHKLDWGKVGVKDACDVLIDGLLLAECKAVLHQSSNVSTAVSFINPTVEMIHFDDVS